MRRLYQPQFLRKAMIYPKYPKFDNVNGVNA